MSYQNNDRKLRSSRGNSFPSWLPLALTVSAAALGVAVWIWSERTDEDDELPPGNSENYSQSRYENHHDATTPDGNLISREEAYGAAPIPPTPQESQSYMARMSGALRRTPSPQQIFDGASRSIVGGITAAGAVVGTALGSIIEEDKNAFKDHLTWSEEVNARAAGVSTDNDPSAAINTRPEDAAGKTATPRGPGQAGKRKTVALVISADGHGSYDEMSGKFQEYTSVLSFLPQNHDFSKTRLFILIYAPQLKKHPLDEAAVGTTSLDYSNIDNVPTKTHGEESSKLPTSSTSLAFHSIYSQATALVERESMVLPFTTPTGHIQILRHLAPEIVYIEESLTGKNGDVITNLHSWLHYDVVVIVGNSHSSREIVDSEGDAVLVDSKNRWWKKDERVGKGRGIVIIEPFEIGDDWINRVGKD